MHYLALLQYLGILNFVVLMFDDLWGAEGEVSFEGVGNVAIKFTSCVFYVSQSYV